MKVLIGDDHRLFRDGVRLQLMQFDGAIQVLDAADFPQVFERLDAESDVGLALIDLGMPGMPWEEALPALAERHPGLAVVVVSATDDPAVISATLSLGVAGYIPKTSSGEVMINALRLVLAGGVYLPPEVLARASGRPVSGDAAVAAAELDDTLPRLTARQREVLGLMAQGLSNKEIAARLDLADGTVKTHASAILRLLGASNRTQAILVAARLGMLPLS
ncbi:MAG: response regulator transcription factor [Hyphomicrobiales bacterium]|nr:response regulator transcription factor [Hyphomicrobiales bacterium]MCP5371799.1 response regulator transcription factor [Hyphomicrobiales bacterium]